MRPLEAADGNDCHVLHHGTSSATDDQPESEDPLAIDQLT